MQSLMKSIFICIFCVHWIFGDIQEKLFKVVGLPMVENCLAGYNSCMFAYGQVNQSPHPPTSQAQSSQGTDGNCLRTEHFWLLKHCDDVFWFFNLAVVLS
jgi:hypothetical protein